MIWPADPQKKPRIAAGDDAREKEGRTDSGSDPAHGVAMRGVVSSIARRLEHFQAKWKPVRVKKMRQDKRLERPA
jgi:hypothetical protein